MTPYQLIGLPYRLGANPERHGAADCLSLSTAVIRYYGGTMPPPQRDWYRRLKRGDNTVFTEELERWGVLIAEPRLGAVGLCQADHGYGLAVWFEEGWLSFQGNCLRSVVSWSPIDSLVVVGCYYQRKLNYAMPLG